MADRGLEKTKYFVLAFCTAFLVLALFAMVMVTGLQRGMNGAASSEAQGVAGTDDYYLPRAEDNLSLLLIGRDGADSPARYFFLVRLDAENGRVPVAGLPYQTAVRWNDKETTLSELYAQSGAKAVQQALGETLGVGVDRYASFDGEGLMQAVDLLGYLEYDLPEKLEYHKDSLVISLEQGRQMLDGQKIYDILRYPAYGDELERGAQGADLLSAYINGRMEVVLSPKADAIFRGVINLVDSDLSFADYDGRREALHFLAKLSGGVHARSVLVRGAFDPAGERFTLSPSTLELLAQMYR